MARKPRRPTATTSRVYPGVTVHPSTVTHPEA